MEERIVLAGLELLCGRVLPCLGALVSSLPSSPERCQIALQRVPHQSLGISPARTGPSKGSNFSRPNPGTGKRVGVRGRFSLFPVSAGGGGGGECMRPRAPTHVRVSRREYRTCETRNWPRTVGIAFGGIVCWREEKLYISGEAAQNQPWLLPGDAGQD